jgi:hypothetical protein
MEPIMKKYIAAIVATGILFASLASAAIAQVLAPQSSGSSNNSNMALIAPTAPVATNNNQIATTAWVNNFVNGGMPLPSGQIWIGSAGGIATAVTPSGDVTITAAGVTAIGTNRVTRAMQAQGGARSVIGVIGNATANVADIQGTANQFLGVNSAGTALTFQSVPNAALANSATTVAGQTCTLGSTCGLSSATNSLGANVLLNNTANYFDGPSVAQGTTGTWFASGAVTLQDTAAAANFQCKLWDGTTVIASALVSTLAANGVNAAALSGTITSPAANIRISCKDISTTSGSMLFNATANSKDSTVTAFRIQ